MPRRPARPCAHRGCPELVRGRARYCDEHQQQHQRAYDQRRGSSAQRGYDYRWQRLRRMQLARYPLCADPDQVHAGQPVPAEEVDHIIPLSKGGTHAFDNLQSLCKSCHSRKTARESGGWG